MFMSNKTVVLAIFNNEASAENAAASLKDSGVTKGDAVGVLVLDEKGKIKTDKVGKRSMGKGAGIGVALALVTPVGLGAALDAGNVRKMFKRVCKAAGIGGSWTPRELRTSFVSLMSRRGSASKRSLGWSDSPPPGRPKSCTAGNCGL
jgi:hypothetical protein